MRKRKTGKLVRNEFKLVSLVMVLAILMSVGLELSADPPADTAPSSPEGDGRDPSQTQVEEVCPHSSEGFTEEGATSQEAFTLDNPIVRSLSIQFTWTDDFGNNDEFRVTLFNEGEEESSGTGDQGEIVLDPEPGSDTDYSGNFTVFIEALDCPGRIASSPVDMDTGNSWKLVVTAQVSGGAGEGDT